MALRAGAFPEKLGHSACSQPACVGKDWCITHPIGQRCTDDQPTIKGRTSANFGYSKPLFACVHRTFRRSIHCAGACNFFLDAAASDGILSDLPLQKSTLLEATFSLTHQGAPPGKRSPQMGWTQRQARPAEPPTSRSEALASCTSHRGIGSIAASPLTTLGGRRA